jgi:hypothetical protein
MTDSPLHSRFACAKIEITSQKGRGQEMNKERDWWLIGGITLTAIGAAVASFVFLTDLAHQTGWPGRTALLLPLSIDALAATSLRVYLTEPSGPVRSFARRCAVGTIIASAIGNAASHLFSTGVLSPGWLAITLVGTVPAVSLGLVVHMASARAVRVRAQLPVIDEEQTLKNEIALANGVAQVLDDLAELDVPLTAGRDAARRALFNNGKTATVRDVAEAVKIRKNGAAANV